MVTPDVVQMCFKICGLTLALDGSEDNAWCMHNFGEGCRELLQQHRVEWEAAHPDATLPPLQLAVVVGGRMRVWFWRVATGRSFCLPTMMGCHIRYQFVA